MSGIPANGVGLALSGGGVRATVFHLGVLARLACQNMLESVAYISSVSGGSLAVGLIYAKNDNVWPSSQQYLDSVVSQARETLTSKTTQWSYAWRSIALPWRLFQGRAHVLAGVLTKHWGVDDDLQSIPSSPRWFINSTCYETGKNWRFSQLRMGDYETGYVIAPKFPIADAIASSAAVPGAIGPLVLRTTGYQWSAYRSGKLISIQPKAMRYDLWDGGVYDNLGLEALYKPSGGLRDGLVFVIVSDASTRVDFAARSKRRFLRPARRAFRLVDIATDQVRAVRARTLVAEFLRQSSQGVYLRLGSTSDKIYEAVDMEPPSLDVLVRDDVQAAARLKTTLRRLSSREFDRLYRHGFEVADATLCSRYCTEFSPLCSSAVM